MVSVAIQKAKHSRTLQAGLLIIILLSNWIDVAEAICASDDSIHDSPIRFRWNKTIKFEALHSVFTEILLLCEFCVKKVWLFLRS